MIDTEDLEQGLENSRIFAECIGFATIANTNRTITISPTDRSALRRKGNLIFDISIMDTRFVQQLSRARKDMTRACDHIREEYCLLITLNNESESSIYVYGVSTGGAVLKHFAQFLMDTMAKKLTMPEPLELEIVRTVTNACAALLHDPHGHEKIESIRRMFGKQPDEILRLYEKSPEDSGKHAGQKPD